jgi:hypothetical protein
MTRVTVDDTLRSKLANFSVPVDICDDDGRVLAHVVPSASAGEYLFEEPVFDETELRRQEAAGTWYSTEEVLEHLQSLEQR